MDKKLRALVKKANKTKREWERLVRAGLADEVSQRTADGWETTYRLNREALGGTPQTHELGRRLI